MPDKTGGGPGGGLWKVGVGWGEWVGLGWALEWALEWERRWGWGGVEVRMVWVGVCVEVVCVAAVGGYNRGECGGAHASGFGWRDWADLGGVGWVGVELLGTWWSMAWCGAAWGLLNVRLWCGVS